MKLNTALPIYLFSLFGLNSYAQENVEPSYSGVEYIHLKSELAKGWNTWNTKSVLSHVLLPEAISIDFQLKDIRTNKVLEEALMGKRGEEAESILPLAHTNDGSYTELIISWSNIKVKVQSCANQKDISILLTPLEENLNGEIIISPNEIWWDRDGKVGVGTNKLFYDLPSGQIDVFLKGKPAGQNESGLSYLTFSAASELAVSTKSENTIDDVRAQIAAAKAKYESDMLKFANNKELYHAMQNSLAWNVIYEPEEQRELTTVSRLWNMYRGGYVIFCWDNYFAAYMHSIDNKELAYSNAIEMTNAITKSGFVPNLSASKGIKSSDRSQPPVGSFVVREIYRNYKERWFLQEVFQKLLTWNRWWEKNRDTDGYLCWGSSPIKPYLRNLDKHANTRFGGALESGLDNSPMYDEIPFDTISNQLKLADVGLMSLYILDCEALSDIAGVLGKEDIKTELFRRASKYRTNLNKLWSEEKGIYLNKRMDKNEFSNRISPTNFYPLLVNAPTQKQAERMINEYFYNADEFWGDYMLPSIAFNDPDYEPDNYWRGRVWGPMNFLVYLGLRNYDLGNAQEDLVKKSKNLFMEQWSKNGYICENYNSQTGECDDVSRSELFYHWGGLLGFISMIESGYVKNPNVKLGTE